MVKHPDFILSKDYHLNGIWEIKDNNCTYTYSGILVLSPKNIRLNLFIDSYVPEFKNQFWDIIHGKLLTGEHITLVNCYYTGGPNDTRDILCNYVISGKEYLDKHSLFFDKIYMEYEEHRAWLLPNSEQINDRSSDKVIIEKDKDKTIFNFKINNKLQVSMNYHLQYCLNCFKEADFEEHYYFIITDKNKFTIKDAITKYRFNWKILLSIFVGKACNIKTVFLDSNNKRFYLYYCDFFYKKEQDLITHWMFMPYYAIDKYLKKIFYYWFKRIPKQDSYTRELFFTGFDNFTHPDQESFLASIKAIEGLATKLTSDTFLDETQFSNLKDIVKSFLIQQNLNSSKRRSILKKLITVNEKKSLTDKVQRFINNKLPINVRKKLKLTDNYVNKICQVRNTLSHNKGIHYFYVCKTFDKFIKMNFILNSILLYYYSLEMGIPKEVIYEGLFERYYLVRHGLNIK